MPLPTEVLLSSLLDDDYVPAKALIPILREFKAAIQALESTPPSPTGEWTLVSDTVLSGGAVTIQLNDVLYSEYRMVGEDLRNNTNGDVDFRIQPRLDGNAIAANWDWGGVPMRS